ncbi:MAG: hypothetical protein AB2570_04580, partial [Candidatus Thiodiazotropha endolucinida]
MEVVERTFREMGLFSEKSVATHLLLENAFESNLVPDISEVDYLEGHSGRTRLQPLEGLPTFVDDVYVYGYLRREDCVSRAGRVSCTTGAGGSAQVVVASISWGIREALDGEKHMQTSIVHTIATRSDVRGSTISATVERIEADTDRLVEKKWKELHGKDPFAIFVAKVDVSEVEIDSLQARLPKLRKLLLGKGYGLYSIDYTQDFSGTLDRQSLVAHLEKLGYRIQGDPNDALANRDAPTVLDNTKSVGNHVCTWIGTGASGYTVRTKLYNKVVSNFEAGEVREQMGGHLADYVDCPNEHLRRTFLHPDVQERGCTRIEVSLYACRGRDLSTNTAKEVVEEALGVVSPEEKDLFVVQPPSRMWANLAGSLDRCLVLADRPQGTIFVAWYAHTGTGRVAGMRIRPTPQTVDNDGSWERAVEWTAADFGFRDCPIFRVDILETRQGVREDGEDTILFSPLRCYTKDAGSATILAACKKPTALHPNGPDPSILLPPTNKVSWVWREKKSQRIGVETSQFQIVEMPEIAKGRQLSTLSTRNREKRLWDLLQAANIEKWRREAQKRLEEEKEKNRRYRREELERMSKLATEHREYLA